MLQTKRILLFSENVRNFWTNTDYQSSVFPFLPYRAGSFFGCSFRTFRIYFGFSMFYLLKSILGQKKGATMVIVAPDFMRLSHQSHRVSCAPAELTQLFY